MDANAAGADDNSPRFLTETRLHLAATRNLTADIIDECERIAAEFASLAREGLVVRRAGTIGGNFAEMGDSIRLLVGLYRHGTYLRHAALAEDFIDATNRRRVFGVALFGRAILETAAASAYHFRAILESAKAIAKPPHDMSSFARAVFSAAAGTRFDWIRDDPRKESRSEFLEEFASTVKGSAYGEAPNVLTMLEALRRAVDERAPGNGKLVGHAYGKLSDICHPSYGGSKAVFGSAEDQWFELAPTHAGGHAILLASEILPVLGLSSSVSTDRLRKLEGFARWGDSTEATD